MHRRQALGRSCLLRVSNAVCIAHALHCRSVTGGRYLMWRGSGRTPLQRPPSWRLWPSWLGLLVAPTSCSRRTTSPSAQPDSPSRRFDSVSRRPLRLPQSPTSHLHRKYASAVAATPLLSSQPHFELQATLARETAVLPRLDRATRPALSFRRRARHGASLLP